jgi:pimeloyl-ACP methyl ester carboxylesterase
MDRIQLALMFDYRTNVAAYPRWQAYLRTHQPPTLVVWGKHDPLFTVAGALAFAREVPTAEMHLLNAGHFALDEEVEMVVMLMQRFLARLRSRERVAHSPQDERAPGSGAPRHYLTMPSR